MKDIAGEVLDIIKRNLRIIGKDQQALKLIDLLHFAVGTFSHAVKTLA